MILDKKSLLTLSVACAAAGPFSRVDAGGSSKGKSRSRSSSASERSVYVKGEPKKRSSSTSKGSKNRPNSSEAHTESTPFFVASAACAQKCISASYPVDSHLLTDAIQHCDAASSRQMWDIVSDGTFVKLKSVGASVDSTNGNGWCLGVVPQEASHNPKRGLGLAAGMAIGIVGESQEVFTGDGWGDDDDMCNDGNKLGLVSCDHPAAHWYSTDGQLISTFCWGAGLSSFLSVNEGCTDLHLSTTSDGATAISRKETFMAVTQEFVQTIPAPAPPTYYPTYYPTANPTSL